MDVVTGQSLIELGREYADIPRLASKLHIFLSSPLNIKAAYVWSKSCLNRTFMESFCEPAFVKKMLQKQKNLSLDEERFKMFLSEMIHFLNNPNIDEYELIKKMSLDFYSIKRW